MNTVLRKLNYKAPEHELKKIQRVERLGCLRERYEELKFSKLGDEVMEQYDRYMNIQGITKKHQPQIEDNITT